MKSVSSIFDLLLEHSYFCSDSATQTRTLEAFHKVSCNTIRHLQVNSRQKWKAEEETLEKFFTPPTGCIYGPFMIIWLKLIVSYESFLLQLLKIWKKKNTLFLISYTKLLFPLFPQHFYHTHYLQDYHSHASLVEKITALQIMKNGSGRNAEEYLRVWRRVENRIVLVLWLVLAFDVWFKLLCCSKL